MRTGFPGASKIPRPHHGEATAISIQEVEFEGKVNRAAKAIKSNSDRLR